MTDIDLTIDAETKDVDRSKTVVNNVIVTRTVDKAPDLTALVSKWGTLAAPTENRIVGGTNIVLTRTANAAGESQLGEIDRRRPARRRQALRGRGATWRS